MPLPCVYEIPPPPTGEAFDPFQVNVVHSPSGGGTSIIPYVESFGGCSGHGWYYEGPASDPERIVVCPSTCTLFEGDATGRVDIALGCATILI